MSLLKVDDLQDLSANKYGRIVQVVSFQTGEVATGTTQMLANNIIPQIDEGDEFITLTITPTDSNNKLLIEVVIVVSNSSVGNIISSALFQDSTVDALSSTMQGAGDVSNQLMIHSLSHFMTADTISSTIFRVRSGGSIVGTTTLNGQGGQPQQGGSLSSSIKITEIRE